MEKIHFKPKAKTSAMALYEVLTKYGPKILKKKDALSINRSICEVYLQLYLDSADELVSNLKSLNCLSSMDSGALTENVSFFTDHSADSSLKTLNGAILELLQGGRINEESINFIIDKMKQKDSLVRLRSKTFIALGDGVKENYIRESIGSPAKNIEFDKRRLNAWVSDCLEKGIEETMKDESWGDHSLTRDDELKGKRSVRLSFAGRVIYKIEQETTDGVLINKITIVRITSNHNYLG